MFMPRNKAHKAASQNDEYQRGRHQESHVRELIPHVLWWEGIKQNDDGSKRWEVRSTKWAHKGDNLLPCKFWLTYQEQDVPPCARLLSQVPK